jgi:alkaline phosphatase
MHTVADSAAGATAFSCGKKTANEACGVDYEGKPLGNTMEAARLKGWATGVVVTKSVTDATPAGFTAHAQVGAARTLL